MNIRMVTALWLISLLFAVSSQAVHAGESGWPRSLPLESGSITIYPPQVDSMDGDLVRYRAALAYKRTGDEDPVFGAGWFESHVEINRTEGVVHPLDLTVADTRFPEGSDQVQEELALAVGQQSPNWNLDFPLADLLNALETAKLEAKTAQDLNTSPPAIIYRDHPALLVTIDGEPVMRAVENSHYQAVINTPYPLIFDGQSYHLGAAKGVWYRADRATGPYRYDASPPADIVAMVDAAAEKEADPVSAEKVTAENAPEIVVATTPTELIVTEGPAAFVPLVDDLLVLSNSADDVFMHISSQQYYVVLAGRWYQSASLNGPWSYRAADDLPAVFASIPLNSDQADSRVYVAGTEEAREAVLDAQVPQPAAVPRGPADLDVTYDGEPQFEPVEGTEDLAYADNTDFTVLQADREYYLVEDGVWYVSSSPDGPWVVSDYRPPEVASISPRSPVYNVKYVYIYDSTPEVVYVGYTPGYIGNYVYHDTIVYGTGWYYRPWVSPRYYYPHYSTWGFSVNYNPWYGWGFGLSWASGPFYAGYYSGGFWHHDRPWHRPHRGYWGPRGYRPRPAHRGYQTHHRGGRDNGGYGHYGDDHERSRHGDDDRDYYGGYGGGRDRRPAHNGRGQDSASRNSTNTYVRNRNLYEDRPQRARLTEGRNPGNTAPEPGRNVAAYHGSPGTRGNSLDRRDRIETGPSKTGRSRTGPVRPSDLRVKAQVRDASREAGLSNLIADNSSYARRRAQSPLESSAWERATAGESRRARTAAGNPGRASTEIQPGRAADHARSVITQRHIAPSGREQVSTATRSANRAREPLPVQTRRNMQQRGISTGYSSAARSSQRTDLHRPAQDLDAYSRNSSRSSMPRSLAQPRYAPQRAAPQTGSRQSRVYQNSTARNYSLPGRGSPTAINQRSASPRLSQQRSAPQKSTESSSPPTAESRKQSVASGTTSQKSHRSNGGGRNAGKSRRRGR